MDQRQPEVMPEDVWTMLRNMGKAVEQLGLLTVEVRCSAPEAIRNAFGWVEGSWTQLVEVLETWTGPTDLAGWEREDTAVLNDSWVAIAAREVEALTTNIARDTARRDGLQALLVWCEVHPDRD